MPEIKVVNMAGAEVGKMTLSDKVFGADVNAAVLHTAVKAYLANQRQGTQSTLTRSEVSGGGRKPWRQKGSGRARQGSTRSPQWTHGGIALGPKPRCYKVKMNKKERRVAMFSAFSSKVAEENLIMLAAVGAGKKSLVVLPEADEKVVRSFTNIPGVKVAQYNTISVYDILNSDSLVLAREAVTKIEEVYAE